MLTSFQISPMLAAIQQALDEAKVYAASPAPSSEGVSDLASSCAREGLHPYEQRGACTLRIKSQGRTGWQGHRDGYCFLEDEGSLMDAPVFVASGSTVARFDDGPVWFEDGYVHRGAV